MCQQEVSMHLDNNYHEGILHIFNLQTGAPFTNMDQL